MRIALGPSPYNRYSIQLGKEYSKLGHDVTLLIDKKNVLDSCETSGLMIQSYSDFPAGLKLIGNVRHIGSFRNFDIVHMSDMHDAIPPLVSKEVFKTKLVVTSHGAVIPWHINWVLNNLWYAFFNKVESMLVPIMAKNAPIIAISKFTAKVLKSVYGIVAIPIYQGVESNRFNPRISGMVVREKLGVEECPLVLFVGRFVPNKDPITFVRSVPHVLKKVPECKFIMIGEGPLKAQIMDEIFKSHVSKSVIISGTDPEIERYYAAADVLAFTSIGEGFGYVLTEAMACGTPVVASDYGSPPEILDDAGLLFRTKDPLDLAEKVTRILVDKELSKRLISRGLNRVRKIFTWEACAKKTLNVYEKILSKTK